MTGSEGDPGTLASDLAEFATVVGECHTSVSELLQCSENFVKDLRTEKERNGISLLELKNRELLAYLSQLALLMCQMNCGKSIEGAEAIERSVYLRTVLERIRPIEQKMKSQIEKLSALAVGSKTAIVKHLQPHPELMAIEPMADDEANEEGDEVEKSGVKKYVPPKLVAVHYNEDENEKEARRIERNRRRALQSSLIQELRDEYSEAPLEIMEDRRNAKLIQAEKEKERYEEDYFVRLQVSKKQRHDEKLKNRQNLIEDLLHFGDYMGVEEKPPKKSARDRRKVKRFRKGTSGSGRSKSSKKARR